MFNRNTYHFTRSNNSPRNQNLKKNSKNFSTISIRGKSASDTKIKRKNFQMNSYEITKVKRLNLKKNQKLKLLSNKKNEINVNEFIFKNSLKKENYTNFNGTTKKGKKDFNVLVKSVRDVKEDREDEIEKNELNQNQTNEKLIEKEMKNIYKKLKKVVNFIEDDPNLKKSSKKYKSHLKFNNINSNNSFKTSKSMKRTNSYQNFKKTKSFKIPTLSSTKHSLFRHIPDSKRFLRKIDTKEKNQLQNDTSSNLHGNFVLKSGNFNKKPNF